MNSKLLSVSVIAALSAMGAQAQSLSTSSNAEENVKKHSIRLSVSDGLTLSGSDFFGIGLSDVLTGTQRSHQRATGVFALGYRYQLHRFRLGLDAGFAQVSSKVMFKEGKSPSYKEKELNLLVLPTAEFVYLKCGWFELYGSAAAGMNFTRHTEKGLTEMGMQQARKDAVYGKEFAYQVNPLGVRVGNSRIGGFVEAGLGYRGFVTAGVTLGF